eukprot:COSAG02_NODE_19969_length_855_cov_0.988095_2_plen_198_part_01
MILQHRKILQLPLRVLFSIETRRWRDIDARMYQATQLATSELLLQRAKGRWSLWYERFRCQTIFALAYDIGLHMQWLVTPSIRYVTPCVTLWGSESNITASAGSYNAQDLPLYPAVMLPVPMTTVLLTAGAAGVAAGLTGARRRCGGSTCPTNRVAAAGDEPPPSAAVTRRRFPAASSTFGSGVASSSIVEPPSIAEL